VASSALKGEATPNVIINVMANGREICCEMVGSTDRHAQLIFKTRSSLF
jgi:hypothetical protein